MAPSIGSLSGHPTRNHNLRKQRYLGSRYASLSKYACHLCLVLRSSHTTTTHTASGFYMVTISWIKLFCQADILGLVELFFRLRVPPYMKTSVDLNSANGQGLFCAGHVERRLAKGMGSLKPSPMRDTRRCCALKPYLESK